MSVSEEVRPVLIVNFQHGKLLIRTFLVSLLVCGFVTKSEPSQLLTSSTKKTINKNLACEISCKMICELGILSVITNFQQIKNTCIIQAPVGFVVSCFLIELDHRLFAFSTK